MADWITEDFEFIPYMAALGETTTYRGLDGLRKYREDAEEAWENIQVRVDAIRDLGDRAVTFGELRGRGRGSGLDTRVPLAWVVDFHKGKLRRIQSYGDTSEALEAGSKAATHSGSGGRPGGGLLVLAHCGSAGSQRSAMGGERTAGLTNLLSLG